MSDLYRQERERDHGHAGKIYEILCIPCLQICPGGCSEHLNGCKRCTYCTEEGCDFNTCPDREDDERLIFEFEEARKIDKSFPCEQIVALAYERMDQMHQRLRILTAVKGLKGLQFLEKAKEILSNPEENPNPVRLDRVGQDSKEVKKYERDVTLCLDCNDFISCDTYYKCSKHSHLINRCLACRCEGHIYQNCYEWLDAKYVIQSTDNFEENSINASKNLIIDTLVRANIIFFLKTKSQEERWRTNVEIRDDAVYYANLDFNNGSY